MYLKKFCGQYLSEFQLSDKLVEEKHLFNNLVLLSKWNFIDIKFPVYVFESKGFHYFVNFLYICTLSIVSNMDITIQSSTLMKINCLKGDKVKKSQPNRLKYIEVVESLIWIQKQKSIVIPKALSIEEYFSRKEM